MAGGVRSDGVPEGLRRVRHCVEQLGVFRFHLKDLASGQNWPANAQEDLIEVQMCDGVII